MEGDATIWKSFRFKLRNYINHLYYSMTFNIKKYPSLYLYYPFGEYLVKILELRFYVMVHEIEGAFYLLTSDFVAIACLFFVHNLTLTGHSLMACETVCH